MERTREPPAELARLRAENRALLQLLELGTALLSKRAMPDFLQACLRAALELCRANSGDFLLYEEATVGLRLAAHEGSPAPFLAQFE